MSAATPPAQPESGITLGKLLTILLRLFTGKPSQEISNAAMHYSWPIKQPQWASDYGRDEFGLWAELTLHGVCQRMRYIPAGQFVMGASFWDRWSKRDETPRHKVFISHSFWMADTCCTQLLWQRVMGAQPSFFPQDKSQDGQQLPVEQVSWRDVQAFLQLANAVVAENFRTGFVNPPMLSLPTEAVWEYCCRAGTRLPYWFGLDIYSEKANFDQRVFFLRLTAEDFRASTIQVTALPNYGWGLYQMHGNVAEWCADEKLSYPSKTQTDPGLQEALSMPSADAVLPPRAVRGGAWDDDSVYIRSSGRAAQAVDARENNLGFRFVLRDVEPS